LVAVLSLSSSARVIGLTHSHPSAGALILAQPAIKFIVTESIQMGRDFRQPFGSSLSGFEGGQTGFLGPALRNPQSRYNPEIHDAALLLVADHVLDDSARSEAKVIGLASFKRPSNRGLRLTALMGSIHPA